MAQRHHGTSHHFGTPRPPHGRAQSPPTHHGSPFQPLPPPTGAPPFRLDLASVIPEAAKAMVASGGMACHVVGDTGGVQDPTPQQLVANGLEQDAGIAGPHGVPGFFYHLGDVVYFDGEAAQYYPQFYAPYEHYPNPIIAIPGNHDGDLYDDGRRVNPEPSLSPFMRNFCAARPGTHTAEARDAERTAMVQPNCYFTLLTPFATFVGLYTNVPEHGVVHPDQQEWFAGELAASDPEKPLIVAMHHPIYSLDTYHSGSAAMAKVLAAATAKAGRYPEVVLGAHVHNYQRFTAKHGDGVVPFYVAGHGGYHNLHKMQRVDGQDIVTPYAVPGEDGLVLESYTDDRFGFLRFEIDADTVEIQAYTVPRPQESWRQAPRLRDRMRLDWRARRYR